MKYLIIIGAVALCLFASCTDKRKAVILKEIALAERMKGHGQIEFCEVTSLKDTVNNSYIVDYNAIWSHGLRSTGRIVFNAGGIGQVIR